jgi:hypothetical protein
MQSRTWPWFVRRLHGGGSSLELDFMCPETIVGSQVSGLMSSRA